MSDRDAFREARDAELKTPDEWCAELGQEILDPDGWRGRDYLPYTDRISRAEFERRLATSTVAHLPVDERAEFRERRNHGLKARHETREARAIRKQVAEEIALAIEAHVAGHAPRRALTINGRPHCAVCRAIKEVATLAREIGSRDPS